MSKIYLKLYKKSQNLLIPILKKKLKKIKNAEIKKLINDALEFNNDPIRRRGRKLKKLNIIGDVLSNRKYDTVIKITEYPTAMTCLGNLD